MLLAFLFVIIGADRASAAFLMNNLDGEITVTVEAAAIRSGWGDSPIIASVGYGAKLRIKSVGGHGNGSWANVTFRDGERMVSGHIDVRQTSFAEDFGNKVTQKARPEAPSRATDLPAEIFESTAELEQGD